MSDGATIPEAWAHLPIYDGVPVPWVAMWSSEAERTGSTTHWRGIDWITTNNRGVGIPDFGSTNSHRQRECMRRLRCQICGEKGADLWVVPDDRAGSATHWTLWQGQFVLNPPMHRACRVASQAFCPHLRDVETLDELEVGEYQIDWLTASVRLNGGPWDMTALGFDQAKRLGRDCVGRELIIAIP